MGVYERTEETKERISQKLKELWQTPEYQAKRMEARKKSMSRKMIELTGCSEEQYTRAYGRYKANQKNAGAFTLQQEIARSMETEDGRVGGSKFGKKHFVALQHDGDVPSLERKRRKRILPPAPAEDPLPCDSELVDEAFMFEVRKSLVSLHAKIAISKCSSWVDELD